MLDEHGLEIAIEGAVSTRFERVQLLRTPCHLGGVRCWAACPRCEQRVAILYLMGGGAVCRLCADLRYRTQREPERDRQLRKLQGMRGKLRWEPSVLDPRGAKPHQMHWRTYATKVRKYLVQEAEFLQVERSRLMLP